MQDFKVTNLLFQFREDRMSSFEDLANNFSANQVPAAYIKYVPMDSQKKLKRDFMVINQLITFREDWMSSFKVTVTADKVSANWWRLPN